MSFGGLVECCRKNICMDEIATSNSRVEPTHLPGANILLLGVMGSGKSATGCILARLLGMGFIDTDRVVEARSGKSIRDLFEQSGEQAFRDAEREVVMGLSNIRNHVVALGGGAVVDDTNWNTIRGLGVTVWLKTPPESIARRLASSKDELARRPMISELADADKGTDVQKTLVERIALLTKQRVNRYKEAQLVLEDGYSTPETSAHLLQEMLVKEGLIRKSKSGIWKWPF